MRKAEAIAIRTENQDGRTICKAVINITEAIAIRTENKDGRTIGKAVINITAKQAEMLEQFEDRDTGIFVTPVRREFDVFGKMFWVPSRD